MLTKHTRDQHQHIKYRVETKTIWNHRKKHIKKDRASKELRKSEERAKELGSKFVRTVKQRGPDRQTGLTIGIGNVDYTITVKYSDDTQVVRGIKAQNANAIAWK